MKPNPLSRRRPLSYLSIALIGGAAGIVVRFQHPELTETQLFLRYWWLWLGCVVVFGIVYLLVEREE